MTEITSAIEAILFASGESVPTARLSLILGADEYEIEDAVERLRLEYEETKRGMRILRLDDKVQMCSAPEFAPYISRVLEQRRPPMLSQSSLETLAVTAYFQPVTRAYIEQVRGVDSSYTVSVLCERGLIEECGRLEAPGRPLLYRTTDAFLRTMGIRDLSELPELPDMTDSEGMEKLQNAIDELQKVHSDDQITLSEVTQIAAEE